MCTRLRMFRGGVETAWDRIQAKLTGAVLPRGSFGGSLGLHFLTKISVTPYLLLASLNALHFSCWGRHHFSLIYSTFRSLRTFAVQA